MHAMTRPIRASALSLLLLLGGAPVLGGAPRVLAPSLSAGGGPLSGGQFSAFTTIAAEVPAGPLAGGDFELTAGLTRRRDSLPLGDDLYADGFESGG